LDTILSLIHTMTIHEDARQGTLVGSKLTRYLKNNPNIVNEQDPTTGRAPLATAAVAGFAEVVEQLLEKGAKAEALSRNGETALLLATRETSKDRARIVQLLLSRTPESLVDATTAADSNNTPLMYAVIKKDIESVRLLVKALASPTAPNDNGLTPESAAASDKAMKRALNPEEKSILMQVADQVGGYLSYIVASINDTANNAMNKLFGLNPKLNEHIDEVSGMVDVHPGSRLLPFLGLVICIAFC
jgi:ankyrin repeat protein